MKRREIAKRRQNRIGDPTIQVRDVTDEPATPGGACIMITLGDGGVYLHTRSAVDLHNKLGEILDGWFEANHGSVERVGRDLALEEWDYAP